MCRSCCAASPPDLLMLGKGRAVELMDAIGAQVRKLIEPGAPAPDSIRLERVADAIVSIEYYMETLQSGRNDPWYMLDNAEMCLKTLADQAPSRVPNISISSSDAAKTVKLDPTETVALDRSKRAHAATHPLIAVPEPEPVDPQFVELFIEEAKEEIASIQSSFPQWDQNPMDLEALTLMRRSFHTLKGSGRMVGARAIAEFGWSIENLLNRIMDKTLSRTPGMMALLRSAVAALPQLVEQLETGRQTPVPVESLMARAFAYADGRDAEQATGVLAPEDRGTGSGTGTGTAPALSDARGGRCRGGRSRGDRCRRAGCCRRHSPDRPGQRCPGRRRAGPIGAAGHGSHAARHLQQGNIEPPDGNSRILAQARRPAGPA
jgi:HPt (histidine-containing phosphotransfer) domain-containing protein